MLAMFPLSIDACLAHMHFTGRSHITHFIEQRLIDIPDRFVSITNHGSSRCHSPRMQRAESLGDFVDNVANVLIVHEKLRPWVIRTPADAECARINEHGVFFS
jgi:hypothetical protein